MFSISRRSAFVLSVLVMVTGCSASGENPATEIFVVALEPVNESPGEPDEFATWTPIPTMVNLDVLRPVCSGEPFPGAPAYDRTAAGPHRLALLPAEPGGRFPLLWPGQLGADWQAVEAEEAELIACVKEMITPVETCTYGTQYTIYREQVTYSIRLVSVADAREVAQQNFNGQPDPCPLEVVPNDPLRPASETLRGQVNFEEVREWLEPYVGYAE